jgi:hypothetical protein
VSGADGRFSFQRDELAAMSSVGRDLCLFFRGSGGSCPVKITFASDEDCDSHYNAIMNAVQASTM